MNSNRVSTIMIGNPGVGKSTFLNGVLGGIRFESGISIGGGLTSVLQIEEDQSGNYWIDTPGLSDIVMRERAAEQIKEALSQGGVYKIIFVITLEAGRVRPDDALTMKLVLTAAPMIGVNYSIVVNKVEGGVIDILNNKPAQRQRLMVALNNNLPGTEHIYFYQRDESIDGKDNMIVQLPGNFYQFLSQCPLVVIPPDEVLDIPLNEYEEEFKQMSAELLELRSENADIQGRFEDQKRQHEALKAQQAEQDLKFQNQLNTIKAEHTQAIQRVQEQANRRIEEAKRNNKKSGLFENIARIVVGVITNGVSEAFISSIR